MKKLICLLALTSLHAQASKMKTSMYGYVEGYFEKVEKSPTRTGGTSTTEGTPIRVSNPHEFDTPNVNFMMKANFDRQYSAFLNMDASGSTVAVKNAWFQSNILGDLLALRIGKMYRPFGLYNERLDAVPTYIGIEPPELFDGDHLLLTRTTNFMLHGEADIGGNTLRYALTTGNDERLGGEVPLGGDVRYSMSTGDTDITIGTSFYFSNGAKYTGEGGVAKWMSSDNYDVMGYYLEAQHNAFQFQAAYFQADHDAVRSGSTLQGIGTAKLNNEQITRLCAGDMSTCADSSVSYEVKTWYTRLGYSMDLSFGELTPYVQWDVYENPEMIANKDDGGDNEAGIADDGKFTKQTLGIVYRPDPRIAIKLDASNHAQKIEGKDVNYSEIRSSFSYVWTL